MSVRTSVSGHQCPDKPDNNRYVNFAREGPSPDRAVGPPQCPDTAMSGHRKRSLPLRAEHAHAPAPDDPLDDTATYVPAAS